MHGVTRRACGGAFPVIERIARGGPLLVYTYLEEYLGHFNQDVYRMFVVEDFAAVAVEVTNAYQVVLESRYDVSAAYW